MQSTGFEAIGGTTNNASLWVKDSFPAFVSYRSTQLDICVVKCNSPPFQSKAHGLSVHRGGHAPSTNNRNDGSSTWESNRGEEQSFLHLCIFRCWILPYLLLSFNTESQPATGTCTWTHRESAHTKRQKSSHLRNNSFPGAVLESSSGSCDHTPELC